MGDKINISTIFADNVISSWTFQLPIIILSYQHYNVSVANSNWEDMQLSQFISQFAQFLFVHPPKFIVRIIKVAECQLSQGINFHLCCCSIIIHGGRHNFIIEAWQPKLLTMLENIFELNSFQMLR